MIGGGSGSLPASASPIQRAVLFASAWPGSRAVAVIEEHAPDARGLRVVIGRQELEPEAIERVDQARHGVRAVLEPEAAAQRDQLHQRGRDERGRDIGDAPFGEFGLRVLERGAGEHAELAEDRYAADAAVSLERAVDDDRHAEMVGEQRISGMPPSSSSEKRSNASASVIGSLLCPAMRLSSGAIILGFRFRQA